MRPSWRKGIESLRGAGGSGKKKVGNSHAQKSGRVKRHLSYHREKAEKSIDQ